MKLLESRCLREPGSDPRGTRESMTSNGCCCEQRTAASEQAPDQQYIAQLCPGSAGGVSCQHGPDTEIWALRLE